MRQSMSMRMCMMMASGDAARDVKHECKSMRGSEKEYARLRRGVVRTHKREYERDGCERERVRTERERD